MSKMYNDIYGWYHSTPQLWSIGRAKSAVKMGWLTAEEYQEITGEVYTA